MFEVIISYAPSHLQHLINKLVATPLHLDVFQTKEILPPQRLQLVFFFNKGRQQVDTNYNVSNMSKITFTFVEIVLTYLNFSSHRREMSFCSRH
jgi:hypothetical protein